MFLMIGLLTCRYARPISYIRASRLNVALDGGIRGLSRPVGYDDVQNSQRASH